MIWLGARAIPKLRTSLETELEAFRWAVQWSLCFQYDKLIFETDSQQVMKVIKDLEIMPTLGPVVQDIKYMLAHFAEYQVVFNNRECNRVADRVVKVAITFTSNTPKLYSIAPSWVKNVVEKDCNV